MSLKKVAKSSHGAPKLGMSQWLQGMLVGAGLLASGNWAARQYLSCWTSNGILDCLISSTNGQSIEPYDSSLTEPWNMIVPNQELEYHNCFGDFQCAQLDVPMDWNHTEPSNPRVGLAVIKLPAKVPVTDPRYGGLVWVQIGGPGSSGVDFIINHGRTYQMIVDSDLDPSIDKFDVDKSQKYYDILGMDPRGNLQSEAQGIIGSSNNVFDTVFERTKALGEGYSKRITSSENVEDRLAFHMNTSPVVADMVEVLERHGQWREKEALASIGHSSETYAITVRERTKWQKGKEKLLYWGLSYGTVLGANFATMQPHRIERAVIDGVADAEDFSHGEWLTNLQDTDKIVEKYGVPASGSTAPDLVTYSDIMMVIRQALYGPIQFFPNLANLLNDLSHRNGTSLAAAKQAYQRVSTPSKECHDAPPYAPQCRTPGPETSAAIYCTDGDFRTYGLSKADAKAYADELRRQSRWFGDSWAHYRLACVGYNVKPKWRVPGPFTGQTAEPMVIIGNRFDPVTPLRNAHTMASHWPGSVVLASDSEGYCMISSPNLCMARYIREYFQTGELPPKSTVYEANERPFIGVAKPAEKGEEALLERLKSHARNMRVNAWLGISFNFDKICILSFLSYNCI